MTHKPSHVVCDLCCSSTNRHILFDMLRITLLLCYWIQCVVPFRSSGCYYHPSRSVLRHMMATTNRMEPSLCVSDTVVDQSIDQEATTHIPKAKLASGHVGGKLVVSGLQATGFDEVILQSLHAQVRTVCSLLCLQ
jgi:hypothetical protein